MGGLFRHGTTYTDCGTFNSLGPNNGTNFASMNCTSPSSGKATHWKAVLIQSETAMSAVKATVNGYY